MPLAQPAQGHADEGHWWEMQLGVGLFGGGVSARQRRDLAHRKVASDLRRHGYTISTPTSKDCEYNLVIDRAGRLERVQVRHAELDDAATTDPSIDWLAHYDRATDRCYYIRPRSGTDSTTKI